MMSPFSRACSILRGVGSSVFSSSFCSAIALSQPLTVTLQAIATDQHAGGEPKHNHDSDANDLQRNHHEYHLDSLNEARQLFHTHVKNKPRGKHRHSDLITD